MKLFLLNGPNRKKGWLLLALSWLVVIALAGSFIRLMFLADINIFRYKYLLHAHSHVAMLGWVYSAFFTGILYMFLNDSGFNSLSYRRIFWLTQITIAGMMVTFTIQGYGPASIAFSTGHIFLSYWFAGKFWRSVRNSKNLHQKYPLALRFILAGLFFLVLSSFGPWGLAYLAANDLTGSDLYHQAIYFYLHFQYNGWFVFALMGLFFSVLEKKGVVYSGSRALLAFWLLFYACIPAYFLSLLEYPLSGLLRGLAVSSAIVQVAGLGALLSAFKLKAISRFNQSGSMFMILTGISLVALFLKFILQLVSTVPGIEILAFVLRDVVIAYLHLVMLGSVTCGMLGFFGYHQLLQLSGKVAVSGLWIFLAGFLITEAWLFLNGLRVFMKNGNIWWREGSLFIFSLLMTVGLIIFWAVQWNHFKRQENEKR